MKRIFTLAFTAALMLTLSGCNLLPAPGVRPFWTLTETDFLKLKPGMSKAEVEKTVGRPLVSYTYPRQQEEVWEYDWLATQIRMKALVNFDLGGKLKNYFLVYDQGYYSGHDI